ncbi:MAG: hypothetical protein PHI98_08790 [Eubacteriales bacterium]|nr:hypothetical protein [Eubacteriales bacterium]
MKNLENLPQIAARQLGGLEATPTLLAKIKLNGNEAKKTAPFRWQPVAAVALTLVLLVGGGVLTLQNRPPVTVDVEGVNLIDSHSAGSDSKPTEIPLTADVPQGSISMSRSSGGTGQSLFAQASGSSFPLIAVSGKTYRMLESPNGISSALLGSNLGTVSEYNIEPALGSGSIVSNSAGQGEVVYAISGMEGAMIASSVDGNMRVFQRVSYAGTATIGSESLRDTLCQSSNVQWIALDGVGTVQGAEAQNIMATLLDYADYQNTSMTGSGSLQIGLNNGLTLQLLVGDDTVSACGTWSCPDFFEALQAAVAAQ